VNDETVPQFGRSLRHETKPAAVMGAARSTACPNCGARFAHDGRFCPFDGAALIAAPGPDPSHDQLIGVVVEGRYDVLSVIGEGGMGVVYEVRHRALGKRFALKALRQDLAREPETAERFIREARTAAAVSHPGLVEITDFGRLETGQVYFVMELLEGQSLAALLRSVGPLPAARGLAIVRQLAHALKAAHDAGIVHRDLKPDNIHVGRGEGEADFVKIVDFGLAKLIGASGPTRAGMVFGTPHYMSPEQAAGQVVDHRADIYALGVVMYEMFTGKVPFEADSYMEVLNKHLQLQPAPPSAQRPELESLGALESVILRALQKRPEQRYANLALLLGELDRSLPSPLGGSGRAQAPPASLPMSPLALPASPPGPGPRGFQHWRELALGLSLVAAVALSVAFGGRSTQQRERARPTAPDVMATRRPASASAPPANAAATAGEAQPQAEASAQATNPPASAAQPPAPARKPTAIQKPSPAPKVTARAATHRLGSGEIVDPWAR
jgi:serine/threonine-protein kinase